MIDPSLNDLFSDVKDMLNQMSTPDSEPYGIEYNYSWVFNPKDEKGKYSVGAHIKDSRGMNLSSQASGEQLGDVLDNIVSDMENKRQTWVEGDTKLLKARLKERETRIGNLEEKVITQNDYIQGLKKYIAQLESMVKPDQKMPSVKPSKNDVRMSSSQTATSDISKKASNIIDQIFNSMNREEKITN